MKFPYLWIPITLVSILPLRLFGNMFTRSYLVFVFLFITACGNSSEQQKQSLNFTFDFSESKQNFEINSANHFESDGSGQMFVDERYKYLQLGLIYLPSPYEYRQGLKFTWLNINHDIKGFIKRKISGLSPNSHFKVSFQVDILTNVSEYCEDQHGYPGANLEVKASLLVKEPVKVYFYGITPEYEFYSADISIDDSQSGGGDVIRLGNIGLPYACRDDDSSFDWEVKYLSNYKAFNFVSDENGTAWIYISIDSTYDDMSEFYITKVELSIEEN